jgi:hypothetical protein
MSKTTGSNGKKSDPAKLREQAKLLIEKAEQRTGPAKLDSDISDKTALQ